MTHGLRQAGSRRWRAPCFTASAGNMTKQPAYPAARGRDSPEVAARWCPKQRNGRQSCKRPAKVRAFPLHGGAAAGAQRVGAAGRVRGGAEQPGKPPPLAFGDVVEPWQHAVPQRRCAAASRRARAPRSPLTRCARTPGMPALKARACKTKRCFVPAESGSRTRKRRVGENTGSFAALPIEVRAAPRRAGGGDARPQGPRRASAKRPL